ncbi:MAG: NUDIX domain-containing protein [Gammaproteobacteria bacterium]|nr:NUDIX domain-containing protein [Gammaproteobacteria bacterium]
MRRSAFRSRKAGDTPEADRSTIPRTWCVSRFRTTALHGLRRPPRRQRGRTSPWRRCHRSGHRRRGHPDRAGADSPIGKRLLEIPAGKRDEADEPLEVTAIRECEEEIGYRPGRLIPLGSLYTTPGFSDERIWLFRGEDLEPVPTRPQGPEEEMSQIVRLPIPEALRRVDAGEILDVKTVIGLHSLRREFRP